MKCKQLLLLACLYSTAMLFSCKKNMETDPVIPPADNTGFVIPAASPVTGRISGIVVDENNAPVPNAEVLVSGATYTTAANGFFHIDNVTLDKYVSTVTVNKPGYFKAVRSFSATASRNYLSIKLLPKVLAGTVDAGTGGAVNLSNGTVINLQSNGIVIKATGAAFTGAVKVYAAYIDPTGNDIAATVPGSMMGQDAEHLFVLQSAGMIAVDLESAGGEALQLASGKTASIKLPIPASLVSKAPETIDTWSLDDRGVWKKEGTATKNGNAYDMQVTHFSFWNTDAPCNAVYLTIHLQDQNGNPLSNASVNLVIPNSTTWWASTYGHTDSTGTVAGLVPANLGLLMNISNNVYNCASPVSTQHIGPFSSDTTINVTVTLTASQSTVIAGTVNACNGQPLANGTATVYSGQYNVYSAAITNGSYSVTATYCSNVTSVNVVISDNNGGFISSGPVAICGNNVTVPTLSLCNTNPNAIFSFVGCQAIGNYLVGTVLNQGNYIMCTVNVQVPGQYDIPFTQVNGMEYSATGVLTHPGFDTIYIPVTGTPLAVGSYPAPIASTGQVCTALFVVSGGGATAQFSFNCNNIVVGGNYFAGTTLNSSNTLTLTVNVTSPGDYYIFTDSLNGMAFGASGIFTSAGTVTIVLNGFGTPLVAGSVPFLLQTNGLPGCSFVVNTVNPGTNAIFTFNCLNYNVSGIYQAGVALTGQNAVTFFVDVTALGTYSITTNSTNGISFAATGAFSALGTQAVSLFGSGTPISTGTYTFTPTGGTSPGCAFIVPIN